jgi:hypothetical protein
MRLPKDIWVMLERIDDYRDRVRRGVISGDRRTLFADLAELSEICRRLYNRLLPPK